jgi:hypothetical protein
MSGTIILPRSQSIKKLGPGSQVPQSGLRIACAFIEHARHVEAGFPVHGTVLVAERHDARARVREVSRRMAPDIAEALDGHSLVLDGFAGTLDGPLRHECDAEAGRARANGDPAEGHRLIVDVQAVHGGRQVALITGAVPETGHFFLIHLSLSTNDVEAIARIVPATALAYALSSSLA